MAAVAQDARAETQTFSPEQVQKILQFGPWPPDMPTDVSNRVSGNATAAAFGRQLFFDARLSPNGRLSCSTCHRPERGWTDNRPRSVGLAASARNAPSLYDVRFNRWFGWVGATDSLWAQSLRPLLDPKEMGSSAAHVKNHIARNSALANAYAAVFGRPADATDTEAVFVDVGKALAAYQETIISGRTAFDIFRDALAAGDAAALRQYPVVAQRGLAVFIGAGKCDTCHSGPTFANQSFYAKQFAATAASRRIDAGRADGIARLTRSPYSLAGRFNDDPARVAFWSADQLKQEQSRGAFRVPALRNLTSTAPYMHDGSLATLRDVVRKHPNRKDQLSDREISDLVVFLESLSQPKP